jgi:hypothetical protein
MTQSSTRTLAGFWSYAREQRELQLILHASVESALKEAFGREPQVVIAIDKQIPGGHDWRRWIVQSLAHSVLFYLLQSPSSFRSDMCRFELAMFRAQVQRIARHFSRPERPLDAEQLWDLWFTPVRWEEIHPRQWQDLMDSDEAERIASVWKRAQTADDFDLTKLPQQELAWRGRRLAAPVRDLVYCWQDLSGYPLSSLLDFLAEDDEAFMTEWMERFPDPGRPSLSAAATVQRRLAQARVNGAAQWEDAALGLDFFLVPLGAGGFWATAVPLQDPHASDLRAKLGEGRRGAKGHWLWLAAAAKAIDEAFSEYGLRLPDAAQAEALLALARAGTRDCRQVGWRTPLFRFWWRTTAGLEPGGELPVLLVKPME